MSITPTTFVHEVSVIARVHLADGVVELVLRSTDQTPLPPWEPGAHIDLVMGPGLVRQYSLCGDHTDPLTYRIAIRREQKGRGGSIRAHELHTDDVVTIRGPRNHFPLHDSAAFIFVAGGIGITPIIPMIRRVDAVGLPWRLHYMGRSRSSMPYLPEVAELDRDRGRVHVAPSSEFGRIRIENVLTSVDVGSTVYSCGPGELLHAVEYRSKQVGLCCYTERFATTVVDNVVDFPFVARLATTGIDLSIPADRTLLDMLIDADVDVLTSCEEGTCGSCEVPVIDGEPDHRDTVLTAEERASRDRILVCVSRSRTPTIVLDL
ncbi:PDR/VanB family oxidoreductase [Rhodococcus wratislaviensis]|uniref:Putative ferredoxin n=1 Tax=Rhodococcus wratislaviensis NBRC 100605 TaxID=1219028 RepID=X0PTL9_RHOWR|nr:PDR/VanB family oxidoreductase [Rhodococcus wratislaviensis]GAF46439.1 putative ferredoxin [Rhodococcus wratislaviensis NBRC 100605]